MAESALHASNTAPSRGMRREYRFTICPQLLDLKGAPLVRVPQSGHPPSTSVPLVSMSCGKTKGCLIVSDARSANDHEIIGKPPSPLLPEFRTPASNSSPGEGGKQMKARNCLALGTALVLAACGGGGGTEVATAPPPAPPAPPPPPPPPPPPSPPPIAPAHIGLVSAQRFAVLGIGNTYQMDGSGHPPSLLTGPTAQDVSFRYDVSSNTYQITLPGFNEGTLVNTAYNGSSGQPATSSTNQLPRTISFGFVLPLFVTLPVPGLNLSPYTYTSFAWWDGQAGTSSTGDVLRSDGIFPRTGFPRGRGMCRSWGAPATRPKFAEA